MNERTDKKRRRGGHLVRVVEIITWIGVAVSAASAAMALFVAYGGNAPEPIILAGDASGVERTQIRNGVEELTAALAEAQAVPDESPTFEAAAVSLEGALAEMMAVLDAAGGDEHVTLLVSPFTDLRAKEAPGLFADMVLGIVSLSILGRMLRRARRAVFEERNARDLNLLGAIFLGWPIAAAALATSLEFASPAIDDAEISVAFGLNVFLALVLFALAGVFREGARLKREEEMTI